MRGVIADRNLIGENGGGCVATDEKTSTVSRGTEYIRMVICQSAHELIIFL